MYKILVFISMLLFSTGAFAQKTNDLNLEKAQCLISASASFELIALNALPSYKQASAGGQEEDELGLLVLDAATLHGKISLLASSAFKNELSDVIGNQLVRDIQHAVRLFKKGNSEISKNSKELLNKNGVNLEDNVEKAEEQLNRYLALLN
ncbi:MAG: hypothetical protein HYW85_01210 [Deltaproteobacteria bacterium]|nr:hypothetical protein [Deltaproteobacteria bacterium]MBI3018108.1 hypothetical protein [Deltaproteobacteria bacterium]